MAPLASVVPSTLVACGFWGLWVKFDTWEVFEQDWEC